MKPKLIAAVVVGLPAVVLTGAVMLPASAATAAVELSTIQYHSPGKDNGSNVSLNGEYVAITNTGSAEADLDRWTLRDAAGHVFTFPRYLLQPGDTVDVHTGRGSNGRPRSGHLYWRSGTYIWDDDADTATLTNASGQTAATCAWTGVGTGVTGCGSVAAPTATTTAVITTAPTTAPTTASPPPSLPTDQSASPPTITEPATMTPSPPPSLPPDESAPPTITESTTVTPPPAVTSPTSTPAPPTLPPDPTDTGGGGATPPPPPP